MSEWIRELLSSVIASTGPRPRGRGMVAEPTQGSVRIIHASTGPRPRGRGMQARRNHLHHFPHRFNGAAPARARNAPSTRSGHLNNGSASTGPRPRGRGMAPKPSAAPAASCFNGAAPARARNDVLDVGLSRAVKLQRGRARAGAECPLLLLLLAQARNPSIAIACADSIALMLMLHHSLFIIGLL